MMMNKRMKNVWRAAVSSVAGVDSKTMADVAAMRLRSAGAGLDEKEVINGMLAERAKASENFRF